jgi:hypothetical protein
MLKINQNKILRKVRCKFSRKSKTLINRKGKRKTRLRGNWVWRESNNLIKWSRAKRFKKTPSD